MICIGVLNLVSAASLSRLNYIRWNIRYKGHLGAPMHLDGLDANVVIKNVSSADFRSIREYDRTVSSLERNPRFIESFFSQQGTHAWLAVDSKRDDEILGIVCA